MKTNLITAIIAVFVLVFSVAARSTSELVAEATAANPTVAARATAELRTLGQDGLDALFTANATAIEKFSKSGNGGKDWTRIASALDTVAMQKDAYASRLYWFTNLDEAKSAAKSSGKPILSLRLLGNLNEEFSCANSRFFRALLYSNESVAKELRENYILHWQSVRPAPRMTIDFGDGRRIERTITGNSIHYILDWQGQLFDALPGLYSPAAFLKNLRDASSVGRRLNKMTPESTAKLMFDYRQKTFDRIRNDRQLTLLKANVKLVEPPEGTAALDVAPRAVTKLATEVSFLTDDFGRFEKQMGMDEWRKLAAFYAADTTFDDASSQFIARQNASSGVDLTKLTLKLRSYVAIDTTRNDFLFRPKIIEWLSSSRRLSLDAFNKRVYDELFRTPDSDPWLGLYTNDVYTALDGNGIVK